jgi:predicted GIY-YIG superfamily endonuclease
LQPSSRARAIDPSFPRRREPRDFKAHHATASLYLLASGRDGTLCIGVTSNLIQRVWQHREHFANGYTDEYEATQLVWYELNETMESAIQREKRLKNGIANGRSD